MDLTIRKNLRGETLDIFVRDGSEHPSWLYLGHRVAERRLSGFFGRATGEIPVVQPVTVELPHLLRPDPTSDPHGLVATAAFGAAMQAPFRIRGLSAAERADLGRQVDIWEDFLAGRQRPAARPAQPDDTAIYLSETQSRQIVAIGLGRFEAGSFALRQNQIRLGRAVDGFTALQVLQRVAPHLHLRGPSELGNGGLDLDAAREALQAVARPSSHAVAWFGHSSPERLQAARAFPVLAGLIADSPRLARAVDAREPLQPLLTERTGLGKGPLKRLSKVTAPLPRGAVFEDGPAIGEDALGVNRLRRFSVSGDVGLGRMIEVMAAMNPDRVPDSNAAWLKLHDLYAACALPLEYGLGVPAVQVLEAAKGDWVGFHAQLARAADVPVESFDRRRMALTTIDAIEAIDDFARSVLLPQVLVSIASTGEPTPVSDFGQLDRAETVAGRVFLGDVKNVAASLYETARRYVSRIPALIDASGAIDGRHVPEVDFTARYGAEGFPVLAPEYTSQNGLVIRPLGDFAALREESRRLSHCVGTMYLDKARSGNCFIFSVQSPDGQTSHATVELSRFSGETEAEIAASLRIVQSRAERNGTPSVDAQAAVSEWFALLSTGGLPLNHRECRSWREALTRAGQTRQSPSRLVTWKSVLGFDHTDQRRRNAVWQEWRGILGGVWGRAETPEVLFREKAVRQFLSDMSPVAAEILAQRARAPRQADPEPAAEAPGP
jgi:hypothetical protein